MTSVLFVGDSITVGAVGYAAGLTDGSSFRRNAQRTLGWQDTGPVTSTGDGRSISPDPNGLLHGGIGGTTTESFTQGHAEFVVRSPEMGPGESWVQKYKPDMIHLMLGVNDLISNPGSPDIGKIISNLAFLAGMALSQGVKAGGKPLVLVSSVIEAGPAWFTLSAQVLNAKILSGSWTKLASVRPVDSCKFYNQAFTKENSTKNLTVDGTHPNQRGYDLISKGLVAGVQAQETPKGWSTGQKLAVAGGVGLVTYKLANLLFPARR